MRRYKLKLFAIIIYFLPLIALWKLIGINQNSSIIYTTMGPHRIMLISLKVSDLTFNFLR